MIITETLTINNKEFIRTYSSLGYFIERDGVKYSDALDLADLGREYTETEELIRDLEEEATDADYQEALERMGVEV